jgi:hypothetical protein
MAEAAGRVVILVPRRDGKNDRDAIWAFTRERWREQYPDFEIFEGHHDLGLFNRSAAINRASGYADYGQDEHWQTAIIIDSDVLADPEHVRAAVAAAQPDKDHPLGRMVLPFDVRRDLSLKGTAQVMAGYKGSWTPLVHRTYTDQCSAVIVITRGLWNAVGGFDEGFVGWGFEDNAFAAACETFSGAPLLKLPGEIWHLSHQGAAEGHPDSPSRIANEHRAGRYLAARGDRAATRALRDLAAPAFEHHPTGIPRVFHRVVPEKINKVAEQYWDALQKLHPGWTFMTHRDPLDPAEWPETREKWPLVANGAQLADLVRLEALLRWGGIYVDQDIQPLRGFESLLPLSGFAVWEDDKCVPNAVMGAVAGHPAIREALDLALSLVPGDTWKAGPGVTTKVFQWRPDFLLLPPGSFYPYHYKEKERAGEDFARTQPWAFAVHHWWGSWLPQTGPAKEPAPITKPAAPSRPRIIGRPVEEALEMPVRVSGNPRPAVEPTPITTPRPRVIGVPGGPTK